jgi:hypothetical protein
MQPIASQDMTLNQRVQRAQRRSASAHLIGQRRQAQLDALAGIALALAVQRLMLAELFEQDHRQEARAGEAARRDMKRCRRLRDRFVVLPTGEALANRLDHLPLTRDDLERRSQENWIWPPAISKSQFWLTPRWRLATFGTLLLVGRGACDGT